MGEGQHPRTGTGPHRRPAAGGPAYRNGLVRAGLVALACTALAAPVATGLAASGAGAAGRPTVPTTTSTTRVSPTTTVTTTTGTRTVTTSTTTVTTTPRTVTSTTVTTTTTPARNGTAGRSTVTTTTTVPRATTTTEPPAPTTTTTAPPAPGPATFDATCSRPATPGLQDYLDSLPAGSVFRSSTTACYEVPSGIVLRQPVTIVGGTFYDPTTVKPTGPGYDGMKPIILVKDASHVTIADVSVLGANVVGGYHASMVGEAGFKLESTTDVTLTDDRATDTWGDGLELVADLSSRITTPDTGLTVDGFTTTNAGRQGVTVAEVSGASLDGIDVVSPADAGFDFESDIPGVGSDNVSIAGCSDDKGFNIIEFLAGPVTVTDCTGFHHVTLGSLSSDAPVTFVGGALSCKRDDPVPCIDQDGGSLTFTGVAVSRVAGVDAVKEPVWSVGGHGSLTFDRSTVQSPFGTTSGASTVRFVG